MRVVAEPETRYPPESVYFERMIYAEVMGAIRGAYFDAEDYLNKRHPADQVTRALHTRATTGAITSSTHAALVDAAFHSFLLSLSPHSAAAELIKRGLRVTVREGDRATFPGRSTPPTAAPWVKEGDPISVVARATPAVTLGPPRKVGLISVVTEEIATRADGEAVVTAMMREDMGVALDSAYFSTAAGSDSAIAGLLNGVTPIVSMPGGDEAAIKTDLTALAAAVSANGSGEVVFVVSPARAATLPIRIPEIFDKMTVLPSVSVADSRIIAIDPLALVHATDTVPEIFVARGAVVHMDDSPLPIVDGAGTVAAPVRSTYQTASVAIRALADIAFVKRHSGAVAYVNDAAW